VGRSPGALVAAGLLVAGCGGAASKPERRPVTTRAPAAKPPTAHRPSPVRRIDGAVLPDGRGHLTAWVRRPVLLRARPGGRPIARLTPRTEFTTPRVMPVIARHGRWLGVISSKAPNGRVTWVAAGRVSLYRVPFSIDVSLRRRSLVVRRNGRVVQRFAVGIGAPGTPTPTGRFAVTDKLSGSSYGAYYGCCILALNGHQPKLPAGWQGGNRLAIHGTNAPGTIGTPASAGCLRAGDADLHVLMHRVPLGTPVFIAN
jgi:hypothetical protein